MNELDNWLARLAAGVTIAIAVSKETRAWLEYKKSAKSKPRRKR